MAVVVVVRVVVGLVLLEWSPNSRRRREGMKEQVEVVAVMMIAMLKEEGVVVQWYQRAATYRKITGTQMRWSQWMIVQETFS